MSARADRRASSTISEKLGAMRDGRARFDGATGWGYPEGGDWQPKIKFHISDAIGVLGSFTWGRTSIYLLRNSLGDWHVYVQTKATRLRLRSRGRGRRSLELRPGRTDRRWRRTWYWCVLRPGGSHRADRA